jgi:hypothetical protein
MNRSGFGEAGAAVSLRRKRGRYLGLIFSVFECEP